MSRVPDERTMEQAVRSWIRDDDEYPADRNRQVGRIMGRVDETRQRRGAWRFLPFGRGTGRVDAHDEELYEHAGGEIAVRRGVSSAMAVAAVAVLLVMGIAFLALVPRSMAPGAGGSSPAPAPTVHPDDADLMAAFGAIWSGEGATLETVSRVYDERAVHSSVWHDQVERFYGPEEILARIERSMGVEPGAWIPLPDRRGALPGERRYLGASANLGGIVCMASVRDDRIARHECLLPLATTGLIAAWGPPADDTLAVREELWPDFVEGWANGDRELIEATVSDEIVHHVAYPLTETTLTGIDEYMTVMGDGSPRELIDAIPLPAPEGERRWASYSDVMGGTLCTFWARENQLIRHDCIVPSY